MTRPSRLSPRDLESLSAHADGRLSPAERQALEARLERDPGLRQALEGIRATRALLRTLPVVRPPRSFALTPEMAGVRRRWAGYPALQLATAMATLGFIVTVGVDLFSLTVAPAAMRAAAPAEELMLEAPAVLESAPGEIGAAGLPEAGAGEAATATVFEGGAVMGAQASTPEPSADSVASGLPAPTATAVTEIAGEAANRAALAPTTQGEAPVPPAEPAAEGVMSAGPECEACSGEPLPLEGTPPDKVAVEPGAPQAEVPVPQAATPAAEGAPSTSEAFTLQEPPAPQPEAATRPMPTSLLRWLEVGLAAVALLLAGLLLWVRRRVR